MALPRLSHSTARWLAPASFLFDFASQQYGMFSEPNMKQINDENLSFFSPQPYFIAAFFFSQQILQLWWLYRLWRSDPKKSTSEKRETELALDFVPFYILGNVCIGLWAFAWTSSNLKIANSFVIINTLSQLYYITTRLPTMDTKSTGSILTHIVSKTFAGIGVLDILHNSSIAYFKNYHPTTLIRVLTGVGFIVASSLSDWIFGACLVYDLVALSFGQYGSWRALLGIYAAVCAAIVAVKNLAR